jgi:predicted DNA-binding protein (MmcQ/YjbR family)
MNMESIRSFCLDMPGVTETIQWKEDLVFKVGGKMFLVLCLNETSANLMSFKCTPEKFAELIELDDVIPAPYMARNYWVALQSFNALGAEDLRKLITEAYSMVYSKLPKKLQAAIH